MTRGTPARGKPAKSIYVMESEIGLTKIGIAIDPEARRRTIQGTTGIRLKLAHSGERRADAKAIEFAAHKLLAEKRKTGEWFDVTAAEAIDAIQEAIELLEEKRRLKRSPGRPSTGVPRKRVINVPFDADDADLIEAFADATQQSVAAVVRSLTKGETKWADLKKRGK